MRKILLGFLSFALAACSLRSQAPKTASFCQQEKKVTASDLRSGHTRFSECEMVAVQLPPGEALAGFDFSKAAIVNSVLLGVNLSEANLSQATVTNSVLTEANLTNANLERASFPLSSLMKANLTGANLTGADLRQANLKGAILTGANLKDVLTDATTICPEGNPGPCQF